MAPEGKGFRPSIMVCMFLIAALILGAALSVHFFINNSHVNPDVSFDFTSNWSIGHNDISSDNTISFPNSITASSKETISICKELPEDMTSSTILYLHTDYLPVSAYIDGTPVSMHSAKSASNGQSVLENPWTVLSLSPEYNGKILTFKLENSGSKSRMEIYEIYLGNEGDIRLFLLGECVEIFLIFATLNIMVIVLIFVYFVVERNFLHRKFSDLFCLSAFLLFLSIWIFTASPLQALFFPNSTNITYISLFAFQLFPVFLYLYFYSNFIKKRAILLVLPSMPVVFSIACYILMLTNDFDLSVALTFSHIMIAISFTLNFIFSFIEYSENRTKIAKDFLFSSPIWLTAAGVAFFQHYLTISPDITLYFRYGVLICGGYLTLKRIARNLINVSSSRLFEEIAADIPCGIYKAKLDKDLTILYANEYCYNLFGYSSRDAKIEDLSTVRSFLFQSDFAEIHPKAFPVPEKSVSHGKKSYERELLHTKKNGEPLWTLSHYSINYDTNEVTASVMDITDRKREEQKRIEAATARSNSDPLTGLLNRSAFIEQFNILLANEGYRSYALIMLDIDNFKVINDSKGHQFGDTVLMNIAHKLRLFLDKEDLIGRIGGDEFIICLTHLSENEKENNKTYQALCEQLYMNYEDNFKTSVSLGVAAYPYSGKTFTTLYKHADSALYQAKLAGKNRYCVYDKNDTKKAETNTSDLQENTRIELNPDSKTDAE